MFNFLTKSRAFKFLCSSCLICSLGAFSSVYADIPGKINDQYNQAPLGIGINHIELYGITIDSSGSMSGTFKWKTTEKKHKVDENGNRLYSKGTFHGTELSTLSHLQNNPPSDRDEQLLTLGWKWNDQHSQLIVTFESGNRGLADNYTQAWLRTAKYYYYWSDTSKILEAAGYNRITEDVETYMSLQNPDENSKLALFLKQGENYKAATAEIDLTGKNFTLENVQFYNSDTADVADPDTATKFSGTPGYYKIMATLTSKGDKSIISGPVMGA